MIEIDGSFGEGGGQIIRTACALSAITGIPCRVFNIRARRKKAGLQKQHLLGLRAIKELSSADLEGDFLGSKEIKFYPKEIKSDRLYIKIDTAGSITLILQMLILPALLAKKEINIDFEGGGTDTFFSPTIDHFKYCFLKILEKIGIHLEINVLKRGYYPEGGAMVKVKIFPISNPSSFSPLNLTKRGDLKEVSIFSGASKSLKEKNVAERQVMGAKEILGRLHLPLTEKINYFPTLSPGSNICIIAKFQNTVIGADDLGKLGKRAENIGKETALELLREQKSNACLDKHLADQILPYMALSKEKSQVTVSEITNHCRTNIWTIEKFIKGRFAINGNFITWIPKLRR